MEGQGGDGAAPLCQLGVTHAAGNCVANSAPLHDCEGEVAAPAHETRQSARARANTRPTAPHIMTARPAAILALLLLAMVASSAAERAGDPDGEGGSGGALPFRRGTKSAQLRLSGRFSPGRTRSGITLPQASSACCGMAANHKTALRAAAVKHTRGPAQQAHLSAMLLLPARVLLLLAPCPAGRCPRLHTYLALPCFTGVHANLQLQRRCCLPSLRAAHDVGGQLGHRTLCRVC